MLLREVKPAGILERQGTLPGNQLTGNRFSSYKHLYLWFGI
jgi:hypothetical protein